MWQISKKLLEKKNRYDSDRGHFESKFWCNCNTRNVRKWLKIKYFGHEDDDE